MSGAFRLDRRAALGLALGAPLLVPLARSARAQTLDKLSFHTDWRAQAEHGGYYQAIAAGLYRNAGIECELRPGGPSLNIGQLLLAGRVDMIMSNSFEAFTYVRENAPFFTIASIFQKDPQVLIAHPGSGLDSFEKTEGPAAADLQRQPLDLLAVPAQEVRPLRCAAAAVNFNMAPFLADPKAIQQGFVTSEAYSIAKELGKPPETLLIADAGFSAYQTTIAISRKLAMEKKELIQRFVDATLEGWSQYLKGGPQRKPRTR